MKNRINTQINYEELFRKYSGDMLKVANKYLHNMTMAEDAVSRAFVSLMENPHILQGLDEANTQRRLMALAKFRAFDEYRREERESHAVLKDESFSHESEREDFTEFSHLAIALESLDEPIKSVMLMRFGYDMRISEIAVIVGVSTVTIRKYIREGRARLNSALSDENV